jgi:hypothetical protein
MPAIEQVELDRDGVALSLGTERMVSSSHPLMLQKMRFSKNHHFTLRKGKTHLSRVQTPGYAVSDETQDRANIVTEDDLHEVSAIDEPCAMENLVILRLASGVRWRFFQIAAFIHVQNLGSDVL